MADKNKDATQLFDGTAAAPSVAFAGDQDTGIYRVSADKVAVVGQGVAVLTVDGATASAATGISVTSAAAASRVALAVTSSGTNEGLDIDAKGSGTITLGGTSTGAVISSRSLRSIVSSATALNVAKTAAGTDDAFIVDTSTSSAATGVKVTSAAAGSRVAVAAISSGSNEGLDIDAKGTGTVRIANTSTGNVVLGAAATGVSLSITGATTHKSGTAVPATAGAVAAGAPIVLYSSSLTIEATSDAPTHTRPKGSLCINTGGSSTSTRMYINTDSAGTWTNFTTAA